MTLENKTIHYCWFGGGPLSETAQESIASWKRLAPDYRIVRWDESNFDVGSCRFAADAYDARKWAFVSDYVRYKVIYDHGGVYFDVGSELVKPIAPLEVRAPYTCVEFFSRTVNSGLVLAANAGDPYVAEVLEAYEGLEFRDDPAYLAAHTVNETMTGVFERHGYVRESRGQRVGHWTVLGPDTFNPVYGIGGYHVKKDTVSIHHYSSSWGSEKDRYCFSVERKLAPFVGRKLALAISLVAREMKYGGVKGLAQAVVRKIK